MNKEVHLSIDDVCKSLRWLSYNRPNSIFEMRLFGKLKKWHEIYGAKFSLYCFAMTENFLLTEIPEIYRDEFFSSGDWLKFGYHGKCPVRFIDDNGYAAGFELFNNAVQRLKMCKTDTIRLHNWLASDEQKKYLSSKGIRTLLYPNDEKWAYDSTNSFVECGLNHWRTQIRFEQLERMDEDALKISLNRVVAFTHEQFFDEVCDQVELAIKMYVDAGYKFIL